MLFSVETGGFTVAGHLGDLLIVEVVIVGHIWNVVVVVLFVLLEVGGLVLVLLTVSLLEGIFLGGGVTVFAGDDRYDYAY